MQLPITPDLAGFVGERCAIEPSSAEVEGRVPAVYFSNQSRLAEMSRLRRATLIVKWPAKAVSQSGYTSHMAPQTLDADFGIYLHIPFCQHICPYCDFTTYAGQEPLIPRYVQAMATAIEREGERLGHRSVATVFFGGGTPSLLEAGQVETLVKAIDRSFALRSDAEITLEANPNSADQDRFSGYRSAGVNRLSIGVQTTSRRGLRVLGRNHEAADARGALVAARRAGFENISLDLIFGWPGQTRESWAADLDEILAWDGAPDHLSLYSLIIEPGTPMADAVARGILHPAGDDLSADLYEDALGRMASEGWLHYEIANFARTADRQSRHNTIYWRNGEYLGLGAGAHGRIGAERTINHLHPRAWIDAIGRGERGIANTESLTPAMEEGESMMIGLRLLREGIGEHDFLARHGRTLDQAFGGVLAGLVEIGMIERDATRCRLTERGMMVANDVAERFILTPESG
jgi:oxygen-independent coproporphyrinogen-3 oxidase